MSTTGLCEIVNNDITNSQSITSFNCFELLSCTLTGEHCVRSVHRMESFFSTSSQRVFAVNSAESEYLTGWVRHRLYTTDIESNQVRDSTTNHTHNCRSNLGYSTRGLTSCDVLCIITVVTANFCFRQERTKCFSDFFIAVFRSLINISFLVFKNLSDQSFFASANNFRQSFVLKQRLPFFDKFILFHVLYNLLN